MHHDVLGIY